MKRIRELELNHDMTGYSFDTHALLATFEGHSLFSIFTGEIYLFQAMLHYLENKYSESTKDGDYENESPYMRSIVQILCQRQCIKKKD